MKVDFIGFRLHEGVAIPLTDIVTRFAQRSGRPYRAGPHQRMFYVDRTTDKEYVLGVVVTVKDQKKYCELKQTGGNKHVINVKNVSNLSKLMDFNYFVINKGTGSGMFQRYHQSCPVSALCAKMIKIDVAMRKAGIRKELNALGARTKAAETKIRKGYKERLKWSMLTTSKKQLKELIENLDRVSSFSVEYSCLTSEEKEFSMLDNFVKAERRRFSMVRKLDPAKVSADIVNLFTKGGARNGSIEGYEDNEKRTILLYNNAQKFAEYEYDDVAAKLHNSAIEDLKGSWVIKELIKECENNASQFNTKFK